MKVFDCFLFFNELDLLEIRLNLLFPYVDYFVIVESEITFQGKKKDFIFEKNQLRFKNFKEKIIYFKLEKYEIDFCNPPFIEQPNNYDEVILNKIYTYIRESNDFNKTLFWFGNDFFQRESIARALGTILPADNDLILLSDADEIISPNALSTIMQEIKGNSIYSCRQHEFYYYLNYYNHSNWRGTSAFYFGEYKNMSLNKVRAYSTGTYDHIKAVILDNAGWHFTSLGDLDRIEEKIKSWGHKEFNNPIIIHTLKYNIRHGYDIFRRQYFHKLKYLEPDNEFLKPLLEVNPNFYARLFGPRIKNEFWIQKVIVSFILKITLRILKMFQK